MPAARIVVEYEPQSRIEGEIQQHAGRIFRSPNLRAWSAGHGGGAADAARHHAFLIRSVLRSRTIRHCASCTRCMQQERGERRQIDLVPTTRGPEGPVRRHPWHAEARAPAAERAEPMATVIGLIGAPTDIGAGTRGASMGPEALRVAGLKATLESHRDSTVQDPGKSQRTEQPQCGLERRLPSPAGSRGLESPVHGAVRDELTAGRLPVLLGWRSQSGGRLDQCRGAALPRAQPGAAHAVARCARRF